MVKIIRVIEPEDLQKRRKNEENAKNNVKIEKSFRKGIDNIFSCVIMHKCEKKTL